jgi:S1-C subfamily serine protease
VIGSPLGLQGSLSNGIVSAIRPDDKQHEVSMAGFIQITAPISPGSSGSPVLNMKGEVIGVATSSFGLAQNINFAIPSEKVGGIFLSVKSLESQRSG